MRSKIQGWSFDFNRLFSHCHESFIELYNGFGLIIRVFNINEENPQYEIRNFPLGILYIRNLRT